MTTSDLGEDDILLEGDTASVLKALTEKIMASTSRPQSVHDLEDLRILIAELLRRHHNGK